MRRFLPAMNRETLCPVVRCESVSKSYRRGERYVLYEVSFEIAPGALFAVIGPNEAVETTLLRLILGCFARFGGESSCSAPTTSRRSGAVWGICRRRKTTPWCWVALPLPILFSWFSGSSGLPGGWKRNFCEDDETACRLRLRILQRAASTMVGLTVPPTMVSLKLIQGVSARRKDSE